MGPTISNTHTRGTSSFPEGLGKRNHSINFMSWVYSQCIIGIKKIKIKLLLAGAHKVIFVCEVKFNKKQTASVAYQQV